MDLIRLDKYLVLNLKTFSRSHIEQWIQSQKVTVNDKGVKPSYRLRLGDRIEVFAWEPIPTTIKAEPISFAIAYEDEDILIVNKPQGLVVHPAPGHYSGTLVNGLLHHQTTWSGINGVMRPGIVHRIDKDTSGLLVVAKHDDAHRFLADQLKTHQMKRDYLALVHGVISEDKGTIIAPIGRDPDDRQAMDVQAHGKEATTHFTVLQRFTKHTLLACQLETGRTHQIRVHMQYIHHPLESDPVYAKGYVSLHNQGQLLHAHRLTLIHPRTKQELIVEAPLPEYFLRILAQLR
jgi:23S rRNA pseudouridine1911/1915/1917 synthase